MASSPGLAALPLLLLALLSISAATRFAPTDNHLIACGATTPTVLPDGRRFVPDTGCASTSLRSAAPTLPASAAAALDAPTPLHASARVFTCHASYSLAIRRPGRHVLRLHFYPLTTTLAAARFHVGAGPFLLLHNFSAPTPVVKEFLLPVHTDALALTFVPEPGSAAFVNAIELFSAPDELLGDVTTFVAPTTINRTHGLSSQIFQTLYRITVAGPKVTPFNDTLWRTWLPDAPFLLNTNNKSSSTNSKAWSFSGRIAYPKGSKLMTREVAPDNVYSSARSVNSQGNLTWGFPVPAGSRYLVRMHFCDIVSKALNELFFDIYVNGRLAVEDFDISSSTTGYLAYPYYIDFVVDVADEGLLTLGIGGSEMSRPGGEVGGFLNAVEIMRMNKTGGGMDGDFPVILDMDYLLSKGIGEFARSLMCGLLFASLFLVLVTLVLRLRTELKNNGGTIWSRQSIESGGDGKLARAYQLVPTKTDY